jgi:hypothetical protein
VDASDKDMLGMGVNTAWLSSVTRQGSGQGGEDGVRYAMAWQHRETRASMVKRG